MAHQDKSWLLLNVKREFSEFKASHRWLWLKKRGKVNLLNVFIFYTPIFQQINRTVANSYATMLHFVKCVRSVITKASFITKYKQYKVLLVNKATLILSNCFFCNQNMFSKMFVRAFRKVELGRLYFSKDITKKCISTVSRLVL